MQAQHKNLKIDNTDVFSSITMTGHGHQTSRQATGLSSSNNDSLTKHGLFMVPLSMNSSQIGHNQYRNNPMSARQMSREKLGLTVSPIKVNIKGYTKLNQDMPIK